MQSINNPSVKRDTRAEFLNTIRFSYLGNYYTSVLIDKDKHKVEPELTLPLSVEIKNNDGI